MQSGGRAVRLKAPTLRHGHILTSNNSIELNFSWLEAQMPLAGVGTRIETFVGSDSQH